RERERRGLVLPPEPVARRVGVTGAAVGEVSSLGVLDPRVGREGRRFRATRQLDLGLGLEVVARRVGEIELRQVAGEEIGVRQPGQLIRAGDTRQRYRFFHQPGDRVPGEVGGGRGGHRLADEDAQGQMLLARVLDRVDLPEAHLGGERLVADHEGVAGRRAAALGLIEHVGEEVEHRYTCVPPTVIPSMRIVGKPTPTGTDWPSLPQVPTPSSSARSWPTRLTRVSASGPLPISVAPLTGAVTRPFSIRYASLAEKTNRPLVMSTWPPPKFTA